MRELIERMEKATGPDRGLDSEIEVATGQARYRDGKGRACYHDGRRDRVPHYTASIDAAVALAERVLPRWKKQIFENWRGTWIARVTSPRRDTYSTDYMRERDPDGSPNGAIALCIAILRAAEESASQEGSEPS